MKVKLQPVEHYAVYLKDNHRPPSRGGNTGAWHQHVLSIGGEKYSFLALGAKKWVFAREVVSFDWDWDETKSYRNVHTASLIATDKNGNTQLRGNRGSKPWRTADTRLPAARREWKD